MGVGLLLFQSSLLIFNVIAESKESDSLIEKPEFMISTKKTFFGRPKFVSLSDPEFPKFFEPMNLDKITEETPNDMIEGIFIPLKNISLNKCDIKLIEIPSNYPEVSQISVTDLNFLVNKKVKKEERKSSDTVDKVLQVLEKPFFIINTKLSDDSLFLQCFKKKNKYNSADALRYSFINDAPLIVEDKVFK